MQHAYGIKQCVTILPAVKLAVAQVTGKRDAQALGRTA